MAQLTRMTKADKAWLDKFMAAKKAADAAKAAKAADAAKTDAVKK